MGDFGTMDDLGDEPPKVAAGDFGTMDDLGDEPPKVAAGDFGTMDDLGDEPPPKPKTDIRGRAAKSLARLSSAADAEPSAAEIVLNAVGARNRTTLPRATAGSLYADRPASAPAPTTSGDDTAAVAKLIAEPFRRGYEQYERSRDTASDVLRRGGRAVADAVLPDESHFALASPTEQAAGAVTRAVLEGIPAMVPGVADVGLKAAAATMVGVPAPLVHRIVTAHFAGEGGKGLAEAAPLVGRWGELSQGEKAQVAEQVLGSAAMLGGPLWHTRNAAKAGAAERARAQEQLRNAHEKPEPPPDIEDFGPTEPAWDRLPPLPGSDVPIFGSHAEPAPPNYDTPVDIQAKLSRGQTERQARLLEILKEMEGAKDVRGEGSGEQDAVRPPEPLPEPSVDRPGVDQLRDEGGPVQGEGRPLEPDGQFAQPELGERLKKFPSKAPKRPRLNQPEALGENMSRKPIPEVPLDREDVAGVPGEERVGREPIEAEPLRGGGEEAARDGGVVQGAQGEGAAGAEQGVPSEVVPSEVDADRAEIERLRAEIESLRREVTPEPPAETPPPTPAEVVLDARRARAEAKAKARAEAERLIVENTALNERWRQQQQAQGPSMPTEVPPPTPAEVVLAAAKKKPARPSAREVVLSAKGRANYDAPGPRDVQGEPAAIADVTLTPEQAASIEEWKASNAKGRKIKVGLDDRISFLAEGREPIVIDQHILPPDRPPKGTHVLRLGDEKNNPKGGFLYGRASLDYRPAATPSAPKFSPKETTPPSAESLDDVPLGAPPRPSMTIGFGPGQLATETVLKAVRDLKAAREAKDPNANLTEAELAIARHIVPGPEAALKKSAARRLLDMYRQGVRNPAGLEEAEAIANDQRPEWERPSKIAAMPTWRGATQSMMRDQLGKALEPAKKIQNFERKVDAYAAARGLLDSHANDQANFAEWEAAKRAVEEYRKDPDNAPEPTERELTLARREMEPPDFEALGREGLTLEQAQRAVAEVDPRIKEAFESTKSISEANLDNAVENGTISGELAEKLKKIFSSGHMSLFRNFSDATTGDPRPAGGVGMRGAASKVMKRKGGGGRMFNSPLENFVRNYEAIQKAAWINKVKLSLAEGALANPGDWEGLVEVKNADRASEALFDQKAKRIEELSRKAGVELAPDELDFISTLEAISSEEPGSLTSKDPVVPLRINGKPFEMRVSKTIASTLDSLTTLGVSTSTTYNLLKGVARLAHATITTNPAFFLKQIVPDVVTSIGLSEEGGLGARSLVPNWLSKHSQETLNPGKVSYYQALQEAMRQGPAWQEYQRSGAGMSTIFGPKAHEQMLREAAIPEAEKWRTDETGNRTRTLHFNGPMDFLHRYRDLARAVEQAPSLLEYMTRRGRGASVAEAAHYSMEVRPNYAIQPGAQFAKMHRMLTPFLGAAVNDIDTTLRKLGMKEVMDSLARSEAAARKKGPAKGLELGSVGRALKDADWKAARPRQLKLAATMISTVAAPSALCWALARHNNDEELLGEMRSPMGRDYFIFRGPAGQKIKVRIPFGGFGAALNIAPILDSAFGLSDDGGKRYAMALATKMATNVVPTGIQLPLALAAGVSAYDPSRRLVPRHDEGLLPEYQGFDSSTPFGKATGVGPLNAPRMDEAAQILGGRWIVDNPVTRPLFAGVAKLRGIDSGPTPSAYWSEFPGLDTFFYDRPRDSYTQGKFYEDLNRAQKSVNSVRGIEAGTMPLTVDRQVADLTRLGVDADEDNLDQLSQVAQQMAEVRAELKQLLKSPIDSDTKRNLRDTYVRTLNQLAAQANTVSRIRRSALK